MYLANRIPLDLGFLHLQWEKGVPILHKVKVYG